MAALRQTLKWSKNVYGGGAIIRDYPEGTSQTYKKGAILVYDLSDDGLTETARSSGVPSAQDFLGLALEDASGTDATVQDVQIPRPGDVFEASLASDQDTMVAPTLDHIGTLVGLIKLSTTGGAGTEYVADTGNTNWAKIIDVHPADVERRGGVGSLVAGDRVLIQFLGSILDADGQVA
jgi:hypothetical protein